MLRNVTLYRCFMAFKQHRIDRIIKHKARALANLHIVSRMVGIKATTQFVNLMFWYALIMDGCR